MKYRPNSHSFSCLTAVLFCVSAFPAMAADLGVSGDLDVSGAIDFGTTNASTPTSAVYLGYSATSLSARFSLSPDNAEFRWRQNMVGTAKNKMLLEGNNTLYLYSTTGVSNIVLNPNNGQINATSLFLNNQSLAAWITSNGFLTQANVDVKGYQTAAMVNSAITSKGYLTSADATSAGFLKQADVDAKGYLNSSQVAALGYQTAGMVNSSITSMGYQTATDVATELASRNLVTAANIQAVLASAPAIQLGATTIQGDAVLNGKVTISVPQGDISMGIYQ
jgi:hypothetical protein